MAARNKQKAVPVTLAQAMRAVKESPAVTVEVTAVLLNMSRHGAYAAVEKGDIPSFRIGANIRIPSAALRAMLQIGPSREGAE
jgi:excisionase family DNA binding protein